MSEDEYYHELEVDTLARTIWGEARGEGGRGMMAVANVVLNRANIAKSFKGRFGWGNTIIQICQKPYQFSCWNKNDPNFRLVINVTPKDKIFDHALHIARQALKGCLLDETKGATHYHTNNISPHWADKTKITASIGRHIFYRLDAT
jgi:N-acetylmuramoyl-L-alanine amidase